MRWIVLLAFLAGPAQAMTLDRNGTVTFSADEMPIVRDAFAKAAKEFAALGGEFGPMAEQADTLSKQTDPSFDRRSFGVLMIVLSRSAYEGTPACAMLKKMTDKAVCMK